MTGAGDGLTVRVDGGLVRGADAGTHLSFRAIPYAAAPVGPRRWRPAEPVQPWEGVHDGSVIGPVAPQSFDPIDTKLGAIELPSDEAHCLHLTVHTPTLTGRRPVFVWIHGGSFTSGSSAWEIYDGAHFARDGVVFVGFNYRLGALGFLDLRQHFPDITEANLALTDAVAALGWIQRNIAALGGDPDQVTIAGESAGAGMVSALLASPLARGLFHRAIPQSGMNFRLQTADQAARIAANFLTAVGVTPGDREALESVPVDRVLAASEDRGALFDGVEDDLWLPWAMHEDPRSLPTSPWELFSSGQLTDVDLLIGTTSDENKLRFLVEEPPTEDEGLPARIPEDLQGTLREVYRAAGRGPLEWEISEAIVNDLSYLIPTVLAAGAQADAGGRVFMYLFTWPSPVLGGRLGSCHALENAFVFDRLTSPSFHGPRPPQELADAVHGAWLAFAATGTPAHPGLPGWPRFNTETHLVMELGVVCFVSSGPRAAERAAWEGTLPAQEFGVG